MYPVQQPLHTPAFDGVMGTPAWRSLPSWFLAAEHDEVIPPDAERAFAHPEETHERRVTAANAVAVPG
jgi:hypothetical protein